MIDWSFAEGFHLASKVWIYQSNRALTTTESEEMEKAMKIFAEEWTAHKQELKAIGKVLHNRFLILMVDESFNLTSGCSIDASVKFIRKVEINYQLSLMDRSILLFEEGENLKEVLLSELNQKISDGEILPSTFYYNNTVTTLNEMKTNWKVPVKDSWLAYRLKSIYF